MDSLSQMLSAANVRSGGNYLVVDNQCGLLSAAVLERLIGDGRQPPNASQGCCIQVYAEPGPTRAWRQCVEYLNLTGTHDISNSLLSLQIKQAHSLLHDDQDDEKQPACRRSVVGEHNNGDGDGDGSAIDGSSGIDSERAAKRRKRDERSKRRLERLQEETRAKEILAKRNLDGLLVIARHEPASIVNILLEYLAPSMPFVVYSNVIEPLTELCGELKSKRCVNLKLTESWLRRYQVLPGRTRPDMNMSGSGGYLLSGIKVL